MDEWRIGPDDWDEAVAACRGPQLVVAGPGAGKTEFLVRRALHLVDDMGITPDRVMLLSFSRRGAADLGTRFAAGLARSYTSLAASTFHSLAHRLVERYGAGVLGLARPPTLLTGPEQVALIGDVLATEDPAAWPVLFRDLLGTRTFAEEVADFVLRAGEHLIGPGELRERAAARADWMALPGFMARYHDRLREEGRIDYGTLQATAVTILGDAGVAEEVAEQYPFVLVDEYQDTTVAQAVLLERLTHPHRNLTAAGDPYQSIYSFRGAEVENVARFPERFTAADGTPARRLVLTTSFRVPAAILEAAVRVTAGGDLPGAAGPVVPAPGRGRVDTYVFDQVSEEASWIAAEVQRLHSSERIRFGDIAVLVRSKRRFLPELSRALDRHRIPHERPDARLVDHPAVRLVADCVVAAAAGGSDADRAVRRLLLGPLFALPLGAFGDLLRARARGDAGWPELLREGPEGGSDLADLIDDASWATRLPAAEGFWHLWSRLPHLPRLVADPGAAADRAAWSSFAQSLDRLAERDPAMTLRSYLGLAEGEDFEATPLLGFETPGEDRLTLTTLHQAKGLEFEVVFIADAVEGTFPDLRRRDSILGARHLSASRPGDPAGYASFRLQEEMRLAYTAMVRARRRVVWTASSTGGSLEMSSPSRFLALVAGTGTVAEAAVRPEKDRDPVTALEAEAWLRRIARDPAEPGPRRMAAVAALARGAQYGLRPPEEFAGMRRRGPETGPARPGRAMSPSRAESYLECPRRHALERELGVGAATSVYQAFGSLIHGVLEEAEGAAVRRGDDHSLLDDAVTALDAHWEPADFGGPPWSEGWRRRALETLERLYGSWPGRGRTVLVEHPLELDLEGRHWRGRADRVESGADGVTIVDYKTTTNPPSLAATAGSLQLGFYALAAGADPEIAPHGPVTGAEFWYPAAKRRSTVTRPYDLDRRAETVDLLAAAAQGMDEERWDAIPGPGCRRCRVRLVCPEWPEGREAFRW